MTGSSAKDARIPVIGVIGAPASGKTRLLNRLLGELKVQDTVVVHAPPASPGSLSLHYPRHIAVQGTDPDPSTGCLCCGMRSGVGDALRDLFLQALKRRVPPVRRVMIESRASDGAALRFTLRHAPFLGQRYRLACLLLVIDARQALVPSLTSALQGGAEKADAILLSHGDLMDKTDFSEALARVRGWANHKPVLAADDPGVEALAAVGIH